MAIIGKSEAERIEFIVNDCLYGIDKDELESPYGWWETSTGSEFGAKIKKELIERLQAHMAFRVSRDSENYRESIASTAAQICAEKLEDFFTLRLAVIDYDLHVVTCAEKIVNSGQLFRKEKAAGRLKWFRELREKIDGTKNRKIQNSFIWSAVATAPSGFCYIKSSVIGSLLDDIAGGMPFETVKFRWDKKLYGQK